MTEETQERDIGRIEGKLDRILAEQCNAAADRRIVVNKLEEISNRNVQTDMKIEHLSQRVAALETPVEEFSRWKERAVGVIMFVTCFAAGLGALIAMGARWIKDAIAG